ncbi:MAG: SDR family oxidoreductase [Oscillospiraceae bacterium]|nr:SDR family oxidoreductase [Oscillospiraceae bacterium]
MKYALVTGATSGIGLAIAEIMLKNGYFVFLNYSRDKSRADSVYSQFSQYNNQMSFIKADLSEYPGVEEIAEVVQKKNVRLSYLVINFGMTDRSPFGDVSIDNWDRVMRANVSVPFFIIQKLAALNLFADDASVLCVSSLMASIPHSVSVSYGVSKAALSALSMNLVKYLAPLGVRINAVEPGFVDTPWQQEKTHDQRERIIAKTALGRFAEPREVAEICYAILENTYLSGTVFPISGGYNAK